MVEVKRKKGETFESLLRRFARHLIRSNKLNLAKEKRYFAKKGSRNAQKSSTLVRIKMGQRREYLKKIGRLEEPETKKKW